MVKNISDLIKPTLETFKSKQSKELSDFEVHTAFIEASLAKEKSRKKQKNEIIEGKTTVSYLLPSCSNDVRTLPNAVLRSALFGVIGKGNRKYEEKVLKATINGVTVKYTGKQLDQADLDVWAECIHRYKEHKLGTLIYFSAYSFLKSIGRNTGKTQHEWLKESLFRLKSCILELGDGRFFYDGNLINEQYRDEKTGKYAIMINSKISEFFSTDM